MSEISERYNVVFSQQDTKDFQRIEDEIEHDQTAFLRVADNLIEVRDRKLYLMVYETFEEYVRMRWGWSKQRAYQLISAKQLVESLPAKSQQLLTSENQARALKPVPARRRARVIEEATEATNGQVTAKAITEAAGRVSKPNPESPPKSEPPPKKEQLLDKTGFPVPDNLVPVFDRAQEVLNALNTISSMRGMIARVSENRDVLWQPVNPSTVKSHLDHLFAEIKLAVPWVVCPYCQGREETKSHCTACKTRGILSKFIWDNAVPEELKAVREKSCKK